MHSNRGHHRITTEVNPNSQTATVTYDLFGRFQSETLFGGGATTQVHPAEESVLVAAGGTASGIA